MNFRCTTQCLGISRTYDHPEQSSTPDTKQISYNIIDYIPCAVLCIPVTAFKTGKLYFLTPSPFSLLPPHPTPIWQPSNFSMSLFLFCLFIYFVYWIPHKSEIMWYLFFSVELISLSIRPSLSTHAVTNDKISFFFMSE